MYLYFSLVWTLSLSWDLSASTWGRGAFSSCVDSCLQPKDSKCSVMPTLFSTKSTNGKRYKKDCWVFFFTYPEHVYSILFEQIFSGLERHVLFVSIVLYYVKSYLPEWFCPLQTYNVRYVHIVEDLLNEALTTYEKTYEGSFTRRSSRK